MKNPEDLLNHLRKPELPPDLRDRILEAVRNTSPASKTKLTDRLWESRGLRLIWAGAVVMLVILNVAAIQDTHAPKPSVQVETTATPQDPIVQELMEMLPPQHAPDLDPVSDEELSRIMAELDGSMVGPKQKGDRT